ncbi:MFS transporter [Penicillium capsulatum]|uniref:MFS transporter n=1 Tax=Penicillium capsulatum TaxID=69766 RepID=A0A9W9IP43_9EURO|nr:MFS transporter [Penicillium capsulatum]KAJ6121714.1 MFS transporter [Penicillium capsulatum]
MASDHTASSRSSRDSPEEPKTANSAAETKKPENEMSSVWKLVLVTIALASAVFCMSLDATILATAIPKITTEFDSLGDVAWYGSSYLFTTCAVQLLFGKLYTFYSTKWMFLLGLLVFEIGSLVCGLAPNSTALIIGRSIAGLGGAGIFSGAIIIIATALPLRIRPIYTGLLASMHGVASVAGPILGGAFTDHVTWRWCFYINLPFGGLTAIFVVLFLPSNNTLITGLDWKEQLKQFDLPGTFFLVPAVICLLLALQWGGSAYPWSNGRIVALFVLFGVLFIIFLGVQVLQKDRATIPFRIMKNRNIWGAVWYVVFLGGAMFIFTYYLPIWFQAVKGVSATQSGIDNLPSLIGLVIFSLIGGALASAIGYYTPLLLVSSVITTIGSGMLSTLEVNSSIGYWFGYQVLLSAGGGLGAQNVMLVAQVAVAPEEMAMATSILIFTQTLSTSVFLAVGQSVFQNRLAANLASTIPEIGELSVAQSGATGFRDNFSASQLPLALQAYNEALVQTFYVAVATSVLSLVGPIFMEWLSLKEKPGKNEDEEASQSAAATDQRDEKASMGSDHAKADA